MATVFVVPATGISVPNIDIGPDVLIDAGGETLELTDYIQRRIDDGDLISTVAAGPAWQDFVLSELPGQGSRDTVTIGSGAGNLLAGAVLGMRTANGKYYLSPASITDGTQDAIAVLLYPVDATAADKVTTVINWSAVLLGTALSYDASVNDATKKAVKTAHLALQGIKVR
jgi:hypothetical protein